MSDNIGTCIWCNETTELTKTHIIPTVLGGKLQGYLACQKCNSYFCEQIESRILHNAIIAAALKKFGLKDSQEAYRFASKIDTKTGNKIYFKGNKVEIAPKSFLPNHLRASKETLDKYINARIEKEKQNNPGKKMIIKIIDNTTIYQIGSTTFVKMVQPTQSVSIKLEFPEFKLPAALFLKIIYEFLGFLDLSEISIFKNFKKKMVTISKNNCHSLIFSEHLGRVTYCSVPNELAQSMSKESFPFANYHAITFWITEGGILYVEVSFFGFMKHFLILGKLIKEDLDQMNDLCNYNFYFAWEPPIKSYSLKESGNKTINDIIEENHRYIENIYEQERSIFE